MMISLSKDKNFSKNVFYCIYRKSNESDLDLIDNGCYLVMFPEGKIRDHPFMSMFFSNVE